MAAKPRIAIVGPGRLGSALALALSAAGYRISDVVSGRSKASRQSGRALARRVYAAWSPADAALNADLIWLCVPDREIGNAAQRLAKATDWKGKIALHSSGALASDELLVLRRRGAAVASVHPLMTFVSRSVPSFKGVPFALEGDRAALRVAGRIVRDLGGEPFPILQHQKAAYHAWSVFTSPLFTALLATAERVAHAAGISAAEARRKALPILRQTLANYARLGAEAAFSGPIVRGDAAVVGQHVKELKKISGSGEVYRALAQAALRYLPAKNRKELEKLLR